MMHILTIIILFFLVERYLIFCQKINFDKVRWTPPLRSAGTEFSQHEIVHPVIFSNDKQLPLSLDWDMDGFHDNLTIKFNTADNNFVIDLQRNRNLFSQQYVEKTYTSGENYVLKKPHWETLQKHCFYHGHIRGVPHSVVALSTCQGISGYIHRGKDVYHIEPDYTDNKNVHRLYLEKHSLIRPHNCGGHAKEHSTRLNEAREIKLKHDYFQRRKRSIIEPYDSSSNSRYVEMYVVNDITTFDSNGKDLRSQITKTQNIMNIVSKLYQPFNIYIVLVGIENWTEKNQCEINHDADYTLEHFLNYRKMRINPNNPNDNAQLITGTNFREGVVGKAKQGTICTFQHSGGVNMNLATDLQTATTIAHELGHNFGMDHDNYSVCQCNNEKCIMAATSISNPIPTQWSSCSVMALNEIFEMGMDYCLRNMPQQIDEGPVCGNGFTEDGEQCDCGLPEKCQNKCCNASSCTMTPGSSCAAGACCDFSTCKPKKAATLCRPRVSECDLPEFCWGDNPQCPSDVFLQNGVECLGGQTYCYNGRCNSHTEQCRLLWGSTGHVSDAICFKHLNTNGSKHGNCGYNWTTNIYQSCPQDDVMCGLLHCVHQNEKLMFWKDKLSHAMPATFETYGKSTYVCRGAILDVGLDMPDPGMVPDGAKCDERKICLDNKCTPISHLNISTCVKGCSDQGVCNSKGHCHCDEGWGPPTCSEIGNGGSVDSGPIKILDSKGVVIAAVVVVLLILIIVAAGLIYYFRYDIEAKYSAIMSKDNKEQHRSVRPARHPPRQGGLPLKSSPPLPDIKNKPRPSKPVSNNDSTTVLISQPVLTSRTNKDSKADVQPSPVAGHQKALPKLPLKAGRQEEVVTCAKQVNDVQQGSSADSTESKLRFGQLFKIPRFSKADKPQTPKLESKRNDASNSEDVQKRELIRNISGPTLISTTDKQSKHLVKHENSNPNFNSTPEESSKKISPTVPPRVSLFRSESVETRKNKPLPPRPASLPDSEFGDEVKKTDKKNVCISINGPSSSPRIPLHPPTSPLHPIAPPVRPNIDKTRQTIENELSKLGDKHIHIPADSLERDIVSVAASAHAKDVKPKPRPGLLAISSDSNKPLLPSKTNVQKAKSKVSKQKSNDTKHIFNANAQPVLSKNSSSSSSELNAMFVTINKSSSGSEPLHLSRMDETNSDDDIEAGMVNVGGLKKMFEVQKKPLLGDKNVKTTQSKSPLTPPKAGVKCIRSVHV